MEKTMTLELPADLYTDLQSLAAGEKVGLVEMLTRWATLARQRHAWMQGWEELRELIKQEGGLLVGTTKEEVEPVSLYSGTESLSGRGASAWAVLRHVW